MGICSACHARACVGAMCMHPNSPRMPTCTPLKLHTPTYPHVPRVPPHVRHTFISPQHQRTPNTSVCPTPLHVPPLHAPRCPAPNATSLPCRPMPCPQCYIAPLPPYALPQPSSPPRIYLLASDPCESPPMRDRARVRISNGCMQQGLWLCMTSG